MLTALVAAVSAASLAMTVELPAILDNSIYSESAEDFQLANGAGVYLFSGHTAAEFNRRALVAFDCSSIPSGAQIVSARVELHVSQTTNLSSAFSLHRLQISWGEGPSDAGEPGGFGAPAEPGDATWDFRHYPSVLWSTPGGDYEPLASASVDLPPMPGPAVWGPTPELAADVQQWVNDPVSNFGWIIIGDETTPRSAKRFDSRENENPDNRPRLIVEYQFPPSCPGDINGDHLVGLADIARIIQCWAQPSACDPAADVDASGIIGLGDIAAVVQNWAHTCP
ncbi:MAG TPA: hypothetical protein VG797_01120 [Phycisphaerales bacterium]|nr:hypothetical protein [Phycisphaerales bacterium]